MYRCKIPLIDSLWFLQNNKTYLKFGIDIPIFHEVKTRYERILRSRTVNEKNATKSPASIKYIKICVWRTRSTNFDFRLFSKTISQVSDPMNLYRIKTYPKIISPEVNHFWRSVWNIHIMKVYFVCAKINMIKV